MSRWGDVFAGDVVAAAMIDRLVHCADVVALEGDSHRLRIRYLGLRAPAHQESTTRTEGGGPVSIGALLQAQDGYVNL